MRQADASAEWAGAQMHYLLHVAQHSARAQALFYNVLHKIANGALTPAAIHKTASDLSSATGQSYAAELARLGTQCLDRLLQMTGPASEPLASMARGELTPLELQSRLVEGYSRQSIEQLHQMREVYFDFLESVSNLSAAFERDFLDRLLAASTSEISSGQVELAAPLGDRAVAELLLENTRGGPVVVRVVVTEVRRADGIGPAFDPAVTIDPDGVMLDPGSTAPVRLSLVMDPQRFAVDVRYVGTVHLLRHGDGRLDLPLRLLASDPRSVAHSPSRS